MAHSTICKAMQVRDDNGAVYSDCHYYEGAEDLAVQNANGEFHLPNFAQVLDPDGRYLVNTTSIFRHLKGLGKCPYYGMKFKWEKMGSSHSAVAYAANQLIVQVDSCKQRIPIVPQVSMLNNCNTQ